jgi:predicted RNase H-like nuclease (RuvC/YqgF family)
MAIPGAVTFGIAGLTGQVLANALDRLRINYIFEHEVTWTKEKGQEKSDKMDKMEQFESKVEFLENLGIIKKTSAEERIKLLKREIEKLDRKITKVDDEIANLERSSKSDGEKKG